jgi:hypothetical protein
MFKKNFSQKHATYQYPSGDKYTGSWLNGRKHGYGVAEFVSGNRYEGQWDNDFKHGKGTIIFVDGTTYTGDWCKDHKHGSGVARFASGNRYEGQWVDDAMEGQGTFYYARGDIYKGEWKAGKICGYGVWTSFDKTSQYEGEWLDGLRHGKGRLLENGKVIDVEYNMGHRVDSNQDDYKESSHHSGESKKRLKELNSSPSQECSLEPKAQEKEDNSDEEQENQHRKESHSPEADSQKKKKKKKKKKNRENDLSSPEQRVVSEDFENTLMGKDEHTGFVDQNDTSTSSFLPSIGRSFNHSANQQATPKGQRANYDILSRAVLPGALPVPPPTRLPPLPGAPRLPPIEKDTLFRRRYSGSSLKKSSDSGKRGVNSPFPVE